MHPGLYLSTPRVSVLIIAFPASLDNLSTPLKLPSSMTRAQAAQKSPAQLHTSGFHLSASRSRRRKLDIFGGLFLADPATIKSCAYALLRAVGALVLTLDTMTWLSARFSFAVPVYHTTFRPLCGPQRMATVTVRDRRAQHWIIISKGNSLPSLLLPPLGF